MPPDNCAAEWIDAAVRRLDAAASLLSGGCRRARWRHRRRRIHRASVSMSYNVRSATWRSRGSAAHILVHESVATTSVYFDESDAAAAAAVRRSPIAQP